MYNKKSSPSKRRPSLEAQIDILAHQALSRFPQSSLMNGLIEFIVFGLKQAWACIFGGLMLGLLIATALFYPDQAALPRYDFLAIAAILIQIGMLAFKLESWDEAKVILIFHVVGTVMEIFKTYKGSWIYPEASYLRIENVPLFSGFMYAAVGSYIARVWRIFDFGFAHYPPLWATFAFACAIYINFFSHHYIYDLRWLLFIALFVLYGRCRIHFTVFRYRLWMPMILGFFLVALFIWFAENIGTFSKSWLYPSQLKGWSMVSLSKLNAWLLLMIISFVLVTLVNRPRREAPMRGLYEPRGMYQGYIGIKK